MADKAKHAFGSETKVAEALAAGKIDAYDILFLDEKKVGWINKSGEVVIAEPDLSGIEANISQVESKLETKADSSDIEALQSQITSKADASDVTELEKEVETKVDAATVQSMISEAAVGVIEVVEF